MKKGFKFHWAWMVFLATAIMNAYYACSYSQVSQFMAPVLEKYPDISRTAFSLVFSIHALSSAVYLTFFGKVNKLIGSENVPIIGGLGLVCGFLIYSTAQNIVVFYIGAFLTGLCAAFFSSAITITLFNKWFAKGQATLLAVSMTIGALVGTLGSRWVGGLISGNGYVSALRTIAIGMLIVTIVVRALLRLDPAKLGIKPCWSDEKAAEATKETKAAVEADGVTMKEAMKTYNFYAIMGVFLLFGLCFYATYQNLNVYMRDLGFDTTLIGTIFGLVFLINAITMIPGGLVADFLGCRLTMLVLIVIFIAALAIMAFTVPTSGLMIAVCVMMGLAFMFPKVLSGAMVLSAFGKKDSASFVGVIQSMICIGAFIGSPILNFVYDKTGSYRGAFIAMMVLMVICAVLGFTGIKKVQAK